MNDSYKDIITPETESYAGQLISTVTTLYEFLLNAPLANARKRDADPSLLEAAGIASDIEDALREINPKVIKIFPRLLSEKDLQHLAVGEHAGFTIRYESDGRPIVVNCYGGLRDPKYHSDLRDSDQTLRHSHAGRTDHTVSKPTFLNIHSNGEFDIWMSVMKDRLTLRNLSSKREVVDIESSLNMSGNPYQQTAAHLRQAISYFIQLVDNPVSPRT